MKSNRIKLALLMLLVAVFGTAKAQGEHWTWNSHAYPNNSTFIGVITIEGVEQRSDQIELGAFCNDECRGSIICLYNANKDRYYACLTVNGEAGMEMTFRLWNHATGEELTVNPLVTYAFQPNELLGSTSNPYVFSFDLNFAGPVYIGSTASTTWSDPENWRGEEPPTSVNDEVFVLNDCDLDRDAMVAAVTIIEGQSLTVQPGSALTVTGELTNTMPSGIIIQEGGQVINATENVSATMEKGITSYGRDNGGWYTIASPMDEMEIDGSSFLTPEYDLYRYNETRIGGEWENYNDPTNTSFTIFENGRGYLYANTNTFSPTFTGRLNTADVTYTITYTERPDGLSGWNLIGNPFPHNIYKGNGGAIDNASLASGYYTLNNDDSWQVHPYDDAIQPGQGILVKASATTDLTIAKSNAAAISETSGAKAETGRISVSVTGDHGQDRAFVYFAPGTGLAKLGGFSATAPMLSIQGEDGEYAIAHVDSESESLELLFTSQAGEFTLTVGCDGTDFSYLHLIDNETGATVDLLQHPNYTFQATSYENAARFTLVFKESMGVEEHEQSGFCYFKDNMLYLNGDAQGTLTIMDMTGRVFLCRDAINHVSISGITPGVYVLSLVNGDDVKTQKIVVK